MADLKRQIQGRTESLARRFDQVLRLLEAWGHLDGWALTERGERLVRIFHESDLLVAEALETGPARRPRSGQPGRHGVVLHLRAPQPQPARRRPGSRRPRSAAGWRRSTSWPPSSTWTSRRRACPLTRPPDPGFFALAYAWAAGEALDDVLADEDLSGGDFVRNVKLLIDLLGQVGRGRPRPGHGRAPPARPPTRSSAGVVAASSVGDGRRP